MKLAIMQPYFFPYIGYFQCIKAVDKYLLYENLNYITEGWMHRNRILVKNNQPVYINAKIAGKSSNKKISEIQLDSSHLWRKKLLNTIILNYRGSLYFDEVFPMLEHLIKKEANTLSEYNAEIIKEICRFLDVKTEIVSENSNYLPLEEELNSIQNGNYEHFPDLLLTKPFQKTARVLTICAAEKATVFINAIGGTELYSKEEFEKYGLELCFIKTHPVIYPQFSKEFHPNLSIIDVLMHNGKEKTMALLTQYELI